MGDQPVFFLMRKFPFEAAHRVTTHAGKSRSLHGHTWTATVELAGSIDPATGMVVDFSVVKALCGALFASWDHSALLFVADPLVETCRRIDSRLHVFDFEPTCENLAQFALRELGAQLDRSPLAGVRIVGVTLRETPTCLVTAASPHGEFRGRELVGEDDDDAGA